MSSISVLVILSIVITLSWGQSCISNDQCNVYCQNRLFRGCNRITENQNHISAGLTRDRLPQVDEKCSDCPYVKCKKIELLSEVCTSSTALTIVNELVEYVSDDCSLVVSGAIEAIATVGVRLATCSDMCVTRLISLLSSDTDYIVSESLVGLSSSDCLQTGYSTMLRAIGAAAVLVKQTQIAINFDNVPEVVLPYLPTSVLSVTLSEGRAALLWMLGEYGETFDNTPYVLEEVVNNISEESSSSVKLQLLSSVMKMFFKRPPECQEMLGRLLEHSIEHAGSMDVQDRAMLYYRLLQLDVREAERVVCGQGKGMSHDSNPSQYKLSLILEFNTLAVMYGVPSNTFITQKYPYMCGHAPSNERHELVNWERPVTQNVEVTPPTDQIDDELDTSKEGHVPIILLNPSVQMTSKDFESQWLKMSPIREFQVHLSEVSSPKELRKMLSTRFVMTMATSPDDQPVIKMFFYAQHVSTRHIFLVEISIAVANGMLSFILKCENTKQATPFVKHFFQTLGLSKKETPVLQWKMCEDMPTSMKNVKGVFYEGKLHVGGGFTGSSKADTIVYAFSPEMEMWKLLPASPLKWFAMAVFKNQLVLIGGKEANSPPSEYTNRLAVWNKDCSSWSFALPPMLTRRSSPVAVTHEHFLIVAGGNQGLLDYNVEILSSENLQWQHASQLPVKCSASLSTVWNGFWYLCREKNGVVVRVSLRELIETSNHSQCDNTSTTNAVESSVHSEVNRCSSVECQVYCKAPFIPVQISTVHGYLIALTKNDKSNGHLAVFAYHPERNSWTHVGNLPGMCASASFIVSPSGELFLVGGDSLRSDSQYSKKIFHAFLKSHP